MTIDDSGQLKRTQSLDTLRFGPWVVAGLAVPMADASRAAFDYFRLGDGRLALSIADFIVRKPQATLASHFRALLRVHCDGRRSVPEVMRRMNESMMPPIGHEGGFTIMFYGEFDPQDGRLRYSTAGPHYPLLHHGNRPLSELEATNGLPLGLAKDADYAESEGMIEQGDSVFLYTYGVIEALDPIRLGVGRDRLRSIWARVGDSSPERAASAVLDEIDAFWRDVVPTQSIISVMTRPEAEALHKEVEAVRGGRVPRTGTALVVLGSCEAFNDAHLAPNARI